MKKIAKTMVLALALATTLSVGAGTTAEAAKAKVSKVTSVDKLTGKKKITLTKGKKATLKTTVKASKKKYKAVTYTSKNKKIATVTKKGVITAKKAGTTKITVTSKTNKKKKATVTVKVVAGKVTKVKLTAKTSTMTVGDKYTFKAKVTTKGKKPNKTVKWTASNSNATVSSKGVVTAKKPGKVTIKATSTDGTKKSASCKVTVKAKETTKPVEPTPVEKTTYTEITPATGATATVSVTFDGNKTNVAKDVTTLVNAVVSEGATKQVTVNGTTATISLKNGQVYVNGKTTLADYIADKTAKDDKVVVTYGANAAKAVAAVELAKFAAVGTYTYDITIDGHKATSLVVANTGIKATINGKTYEADVVAGVITVKGDVTSDTVVKDLVAKKYVTVKTVQK